MDYFRLLCIDLITKKINPSECTQQLASLSEGGVYRQEAIGGDDSSDEEHVDIYQETLANIEGGNIYII